MNHVSMSSSGDGPHTAAASPAHGGAAPAGKSRGVPFALGAFAADRAAAADDGAAADLASGGGRRSPADHAHGTTDGPGLLSALATLPRDD